MAYGNYAPFYRGGYFNPMQTPQMPNMAENQNQFAQPYQVPMHTPTMPTPTPNNDMIFVLGQNEAESYPVAPNATVTMWDKNQKTFYIKTANAQGIPSMQIYDFTERVENTPKTPENHVCNCGDKFIPKSELQAINGKFEDISGKIEGLEAKIKELTSKPTTKTTKSTKTEDE
jgi:hypothetical protein